MSINLVDKDEQLSFNLIEDAEIKPYYWVNQSNDLVNAQQDLTLTERRIIFALVSLVQPEDKDFKVYILQIKELANLIGVSENSFYERVEKAVDGLQSKFFTVKRRSTDNKNNEIIDKINWIQQATYIKGQGIVRIKLSDSLAEYLMNLKKYTGYQLFNVLQLRSEYSWRLYELLKEREPWNKRVMKVSELRELLAIPDDKLTLMKNFRAVVLDKAKKEIEEKTDIKFNYEVHKKIGRRIDSFVFDISKNEKNIDKLLSNEFVDYDIQVLLNRLIANGVKRDKATSFIKSYHPRYIEDNLLYVMRGNNHIGNIAGYIVKAVENNYADSRHEIEEHQKSLYSLRVGNHDNKIKEANIKDVLGLEEIYNHFQHILHKEKPTTAEDMSLIGTHRKERIFEKLEMIEKERRERKLPPLTLNDFNDNNVKSFFREWYEKKTN